GVDARPGLRGAPLTRRSFAPGDLETTVLSRPCLHGGSTVPRRTPPRHSLVRLAPLPDSAHESPPAPGAPERRPRSRGARPSALNLDGDRVVSRARGRARGRV